MLIFQADFLHQFAQGLCYLHTLPHPVTHGDVKLSNALVDAGLVIKVRINLLSGFISFKIKRHYCTDI